MSSQRTAFDLLRAHVDVAALSCAIATRLLTADVFGLYNRPAVSLPRPQKAFRLIAEAHRRPHSMKSSNTAPEFGVVMTIVERPDQVEWAVQRLRAVYQNVPIMLISDGRYMPRYLKIAEVYDGTYIRGEKLKRLRRGAEWWQRWCEAAISLGTAHVLKIDPDTSFNRRVNCWPEFDCFGSIACANSFREHVQGGIQGFRRSAIECILKAGICLAPEFRDAGHWAWDSRLITHYKRTQYMSTDQTLRRILFDLKLTWGPWGEVKSFWRMTPANAAKFAISHPHKWCSLQEQRT